MKPNGVALPAATWAAAAGPGARGHTAEHAVEVAYAVMAKLPVLPSRAPDRIRRAEKRLEILAMLPPKLVDRPRLRRIGHTTRARGIPLLLQLPCKPIPFAHELAEGHAVEKLEGVVEFWVGHGPQNTGAKSEVLPTGALRAIPAPFTVAIRELVGAESSPIASVEVPSRGLKPPHQQTGGQRPPHRACSKARHRSRKRRSAWELFLMAVLLDAGLKLERAPAKGPDIRIRLDSGKTCWIEATTPTPGIGDNAVFQRPPGSWAGALYKEDGLLLRYRSALEDKLKKAEGYKTACIVGAEDVCLIAISQGAILDSDLHDHETPALARAVFPIGETVLRVVPYSEQPPTVETTTRLNVPKANKQPVSTTFFLEPRTEFISGVVFARHAIWNLTWRASEALGVIHRPHATTPLPRGTIPSRCEMWVDDDGALAHRGGARCTGSTPSSLACRWEATGTGPHRATFEGRGSPWLSPQQPCLSASRLSPSLTWRLCSAVCPLRLVRASLGPRDPSRMASPGYARSP